MFQTSAGDTATASSNEQNVYVYGPNYPDHHHHHHHHRYYYYYTTTTDKYDGWNWRRKRSIKKDQKK